MNDKTAQANRIAGICEVLPQGHFRPGVGAILWYGFLLAAPLVMALAGTPFGHSYNLNMSWFGQVDALLVGGVFPPRDLPGLWGGLGGLDFFFYGPLPFWFASVLRHSVCFACSPDTAFALAAGVALSASVLAFQVFAQRFVTAPAARIGALVYALLPYHLVADWIWRQAVGEFFAYVFLPLIAAGIDVVLRERRFSPVLPLALAGLAVTHLPTLLLAAHVFGVVVVVWAVRERSDPGAVAGAFLRLILLAVLGAAMAAAIWLPAMALIGEVSGGELYTGPLVATLWLVGPGATSPHRVLTAGLVCVLLINALIILKYLLLARPSRSPALTLWCLVPFVTCLVLMTTLSRPLWEHWIIAKVQFPWRLIAFCDLAAGLAAVWVAQFVPVGKRVPEGFVWVALLAAASMVALARQTFEKPGYSTAEAVAMRTIGALEYLPPTAVEAVRSSFPVAASDRDIAIRESGDLSHLVAEASRGASTFVLSSRHASAVPESGATELVLPMFYWRFWEGRTADRKALELSPDPTLGIVRARRPDGAPIVGRVELVLPWLPSERLGAWLSAAGTVIWLLLLLAGRRRRIAPGARTS